MSEDNNSAAERTIYQLESFMEKYSEYDLYGLLEYKAIWKAVEYGNIATEPYKERDYAKICIIMNFIEYFKDGNEEHLRNIREIIHDYREEVYSDEDEDDDTE